MIQNKSTRKQWVKGLLSKSDALGEALGVPVGQLLGCGYYGCAFLSTPPWVVKLTLDPTEPAMWTQILDLINETPSGGLGFCRIKDMVRLKPDAGTGKRKRRIYGIVREEADPVFIGAVPHMITKETAEILDVPEDWQEEITAPIVTFLIPHEQQMMDQLVQQYDYDPQRAYMAVQNLVSFHKTISSLVYYRERQLDMDEGLLTEADVLEEAPKAIWHMDGWVGEGLRDSLEMMTNAGIILGDLHLENIGWRRYPSAGGTVMKRCIVITDPGNTPTKYQPRVEERMIRNPSRLWRR